MSGTERRGIGWLDHLTGRDAAGLAAAADRARDAGRWKRAAALYRRALAQDPTPAHLWVQLGHAAKESGDLGGAEAAYFNALDRTPEDPDAHLQLGHLLKLQGRRSAAAAAYARSVELDPQGPHALPELRALLRSGVPLDAEMATAALKAARPASRRSPSPDDAKVLSRVVVFDVSDLIAYFRHARLPTGIQRVQIELVGALLRSSETRRRVWVCAFDETRDGWVRLDRLDFLDLAEAALASGDVAEPGWLARLDRLRDHLLLAPPLTFPRDRPLINLGTSWWLQNYFLKVREAQRAHGVRYVPFVHDMIPIMAPEHCVKPLVRDFISWALGVFGHADAFLTNSQASRAELLAVADRLGVAVDPERIRVVRLDADFRRGDAARGAGVLKREDLPPGGFMLFVSTLESRKNHVEVLAALQRLLRTHGPDRVPRLVCVGGKGWLNDAVFARLRANPTLARHVLILSGIADDELQALYAACRFTLYPSLYEGWGLPVTESLSHGKAVLASFTSSIPEAGGDLAVYYRPGDLDGLTEAMERLIFDDGWREGLEAAIRRRFRPRSWLDLGREILAACDDWTARPSYDRPAPEARSGRLHRLARSMALGLDVGQTADEAFRAGVGWAPPEDWGCRARSGARIVFRLDLPAGTPLRLHLGLRAFEEARRCSVRGPDGGRWSGHVLSAATRWVVLEGVAPGPDRLLAIELGVAPSDRQAHPGERVDVGVIGFMVCAADDAAARADFLAGTTSGGWGLQPPDHSDD